MVDSEQLAIVRTMHSMIAPVVLKQIIVLVFMDASLIVY